MDFAPSREDGPEDYLTRQELADFFKVSLSTVDRWTAEGLPHVTLGVRSKRFRVSEVLVWAHNRHRVGR